MQQKQICQTLNAQQDLHCQLKPHNYCIQNKGQKVENTQQRNMQTSSSTKIVDISHRKDRGRQREAQACLTKTKQPIAYLLPITILLLLLLPNQSLAQCPWTRDSAELHSDCICDFNPSLTTNLEHKHQVNRMSVQCAPVDFDRLIQALKQTASIELPAQLAFKLHLVTDNANRKLQSEINSGDDGGENANDGDDESVEFREATLQLASQAKLDLLHVSNSSIGHLAKNSFIMDTANSSGGNQLLPPYSTGRHLVVAIQSLHLSRCKIELIAPGAFNGLEWSLTSLSLSDNQLQFVPTGALQRLINLRVLDLSNNRISQLSAHAFVSLTKLNTLRLADNRIGSHQPSQQQNQQQPVQPSGWFEFSAGSRANSSANGASGLDPMAFAGLEASLTDLNLKNTQLEVFPVAIKRLTRLAFLNLAQNQISLIPGRSFAIMSSLTAINLERNRISNIDDETFYGVEESLSSLSLLGNLLDTFPVQQLAKLISIRRLDMGFNGIETLPNNAFASNKRLILVALDGNPLETLPEAAFKPLEGTLRGMSIGGKALNCDCRLSWMLRWQQEFNIQISSRERLPQFCAKPHYLRSLVSFAALKPEHLTCSDLTQTTSTPQVPILPRNSTSNAWTANGNNHINAFSTSGGHTELTSSSSNSQQPLPTSPYLYTIPNQLSEALQPSTTIRIPTTTTPGDLSLSPTIGQPTLPVITSETLQIIESTASPQREEPSERSIVIPTTTTTSAANEVSQQINFTGTRDQSQYTTHMLLDTGEAERDLVEAGTGSADTTPATDNIGTPKEAVGLLKISGNGPDVPVLEAPVSGGQFGERTNSQNGSDLSSAEVDTNQQLLSNGVISLPDDELFVSDPNRKPLNRQGFVAQRARGQTSKISIPVEANDEIQRLTPNVTTTISRASLIINPASTQIRRLNRTNEQPNAATNDELTELKRYKPVDSVFGSRANNGIGALQRWEHRRPSSTSTHPQATNSTRQATTNNSSTASSPPVVPAVPTTMNVYKATAQPALAGTHSLVNQSSQVVRVGHRPLGNHLNKGARFVDPIGGEEYSKSFRIEPTRARHQPVADLLHHQSNATRQLVDSSIERYSSASSSSVSSSPIQLTRPSNQTLAQNIDQPRTMQPQLDRVAPSELLSTTARSIDRGDPLNLLASSSRGGALQNNSRMSVSSMYRLAKPAIMQSSTATSTTSTTTTTTMAPDLNSLQSVGSSSEDRLKIKKQNEMQLPTSSVTVVEDTEMNRNWSSPSRAPQNNQNSEISTRAETTTRVAATVTIVESLTPKSHSLKPTEANKAKTTILNPTVQQPARYRQVNKTESKVTSSSPDSTEMLEVHPNMSDQSQGEEQAFGLSQISATRSTVGQQFSRTAANSGAQLAQERVKNTESSGVPSIKLATESKDTITMQEILNNSNTTTSTTRRPQLTSIGTGTHTTSVRPILVTRESFGQVPRHLSRDHVAPTIGGSQDGLGPIGFGSSRLFGRFIRLPDFNQMALILAAILCLFILSMALMVVCVCYSTYKAENKPTEPATDASRLSSFSSTDESPVGAACHLQNTQQQQVLQRISANKSSSCMSKLFCCWSGSTNLRSTSTKRLTPMRSLMLQDDDNSSGSSASQGVKCTGNSMLLASATRRNNLDDQELLFQTMKDPVRAEKKPWMNSLSKQKQQKHPKRKGSNLGRASFDNHALDHGRGGIVEAQQKSDKSRQLQRESSIQRRPPVGEQEYFMGRRRSWTMAQGIEFLDSTKRQISGQDIETLSESCDSDKSCSPGANRNNRYNISDAHRAYLASKEAHQIQASLFVSSTANTNNGHRSSGLLKAMDEHQRQKQQQQHGSMKAQTQTSDYFEATSSDKSTTDDSRATLADLPRFKNEFRMQNSAQSGSRGTRTFGVPMAKSRSLMRLQQQHRQDMQMPGNVSEHAPGGGCEEYMSSELVPMSAEEQWPEPYVDPADEQQMISFDRKDRQFVQYRPEANYTATPAPHQHRSQKLSAMMEQSELGARQRFLAHHRTGSSSTILKSNGPHDDMYLSNWHTMRKTMHKSPSHRHIHEPVYSGSYLIHNDHHHHQQQQPINHQNQQNQRHRKQLVPGDTDTIHGLTKMGNTSLLRYRSIPTLNTALPDRLDTSKEFLASQIAGASNWLRWTPTNFPATTSGDVKVISCQQDNGARDVSARSWNRDNQVDTMYIATGQQPR